MKFSQPMLRGLFRLLLALTVGCAWCSPVVAQKSREKLEQALAKIKDPSPEMRAEGATELGVRFNYRALKPLLGMLHDSDVNVRLAASTQLERLLQISPLREREGKPIRNEEDSEMRTMRREVRLTNQDYETFVVPNLERIGDELKRLENDRHDIAWLARQCRIHLARNDLLARITLSEGVGKPLTEHPDGKLVIKGKDLLLLSEDGASLGEFRGHGKVTCWALHGSSRLLAVGLAYDSIGRSDGTRVGNIQLYDMKTKKQILEIHGAEKFGPVTDLAFEGDTLLYQAGDYVEKGGK